MRKIKATIKVPTSRAEEFLNQLYREGIEIVEVELVPYTRFVRESRMNYDCVFPEMWTEEKDASYLCFYFEDSDEGRDESFELEYAIMQVPLNLCYEDC